MKTKLLAFLIVILGFSSCLAQKNISTQNLLWSRYSLQLQFHPKWSFKQELEERTYWFPWKQHQFIARSNIQRKLGEDWTTGLGFSYFLQTSPQDPNNPLIINKTELRPQLELSTNQSLSEKFKLNHRYWTEIRIFEQNKGKFEYGNLRFRYKLELNYQPIEQIKFYVFDEIFINAGSKITSNVFDQNRVGGGIIYYPIKNLGLELGYFHWFQERASGVDFYSRHILRFSINQKISLKKKENTKPLSP